MEYQGWVNSATWSVAYLVDQNREAYSYLTNLAKTRIVLGEDVKFAFNHFNCGKRDEWTEGRINYTEIADTHYNLSERQGDYTITFKGRENGAIGICYKIVDTFKGLNLDEAKSSMYDNYEHIKIMEVKGSKL